MSATQPAPGGGDVPPVVTERRDRALVVTINRPAVRNAVNLAVAHGIGAAMQTLDADSGLDLAVVTGNGGTFCAGMDLKAFAAGEAPVVEGRGFAGLTDSPPNKPLIAAVEGWALAGGFEIALACDLIVAGAGAHFGLPEVRRGLIAAGGGLFRLAHTLPFHVAMAIGLTGAVFDAEEAHRLGLVYRVVADGAALEAALDLAREISANGPLAVRATKALIMQAARWSDPDELRAQASANRTISESADAHEGAVAFAERRRPIWRGR
jgi:enoyl-CoA hydratase